MSPQQVHAELEAERNRTLASMLVRVVGLFFAAVITVLFGLVPFLLGIGAQALLPRRIPAFFLGSLAAAAFFVLWHFTGSLLIRIGDGSVVWASAILSLILFTAFFASGAALFREFFPGRFTTASASPTPQ